jgi:hypothetical protein
MVAGERDTMQTVELVNRDGFFFSPEGDRRIVLADIPVDDTVETLENGDTRKWMQLALRGVDWQNGPDTFDITEAQVGEAVRNFKASGKSPIPVTLGHVWDSAAPAAAWIEDLEERDGAPWGLMRFLSKTWTRIVEGEYLYFSLEFVPNNVDRHGNKIGFEIVGGAILNKPFFPIRVDQESNPGGQHRYRLSRFTGASRRPQEDPVTTPNATTPPAAPAAPAPTPTPAAPRIEGGMVSLSKEQFDGLLAAQREVETLRAKVATMESEKATNDSRIQKLERGRIHDRIQNAVNALLAQGVILKLGDHVIKDEGSAFDWLASAPFGVNTVEGLEKLVNDSEASAHLPRVRLGGEASGGTDRQPPADLTTEAGRHQAVRRHVELLKRKYSKEEMETVLRGRPGGVWEFARQDLAAENPERRNDIMRLEQPKS